MVLFMKILRKALRLFGLALMIILASFGMGLTGVFLPTNREKYQHNEIKIEQVDKKEEEEEEEEEEKN